MITIYDANDWLNKYEGGYSLICDAAKQLLKLAKDSLKLNDYEEGWYLVQRIANICQEFGASAKEKADTRVACAVIIYEMGKLYEAAELLYQAQINYGSDLHNKAAALWMRGYVLWKIPPEHDKAIVEWRKSIQYLEELTDDVRFEHQFAIRDMYRLRIDAMNRAMETAIENDGVD